MKITKEKYCIVSKAFPLKFYSNGYEYDELTSDVFCDYKKNAKMN